MNNKAVGAIAFAAGAITGSVVSWIFAKKKYDTVVEEVCSAEEVFAKRDKEKKERETTKEEKVEVVEEDDDPEVDIYDDLIEYLGYSGVKEEKEDVDVERPYVITPDEFDEFDDYEAISLVYFADGVLTSDNYDVVDDVDDIVGADSLNHFGEYEDDSVFVRNDRLKSDFEILIDQRKYSDVIKTMPYRNMGV